MPLFEIKFKTRISGYGGPGSSWAMNALTMIADSKKDAHKFFSELILVPEPPHFYTFGLAGKELGAWYRPVEVQAVNPENYGLFNVFASRPYTKAELLSHRLDWIETRLSFVARHAQGK